MDLFHCLKMTMIGFCTSRARAGARGRGEWQFAKIGFDEPIWRIKKKKLAHLHASKLTYGGTQRGGRAQKGRLLKFPWYGRPC